MLVAVSWLAAGQYVDFLFTHRFKFVTLVFLDVVDVGHDNGLSNFSGNIDMLVGLGYCAAAWFVYAEHVDMLDVLLRQIF